MKTSTLLLSAAAIASSFANAQDASDQKSASSRVETIFVYGEPDTTKTATKLNLSVFETPQMVSVISRDQMDDFSLRETNALLSYVPGVTVEQVETGRTYYTARGFDIVNFQYDGVGVPFSYGISNGHDDTTIYEQVEVVKGATGLITGLANPSATINYVRKRPTDELQASVLTAAGSWNQYRVNGDISGSISDEKLKGRMVVSHQDGDSYLDRFNKELTVFYGILSSGVTDSSRLSLSHSVNVNHSKANSSGALPLLYSDGSVTNYDISTNTAPEWAYQDVKQSRTFVEFEQDLGSHWQLKAIYTHNVQDAEWESFYIAGAPDPVTEEGLTAHASFYEAKDKENIIDIFVTGSFPLFGRHHEIVAGLNLADITLTGRSIYSEEWNYDPVGPDWAEGNAPRPTINIYDAATQSTDIDQEQDSSYFSARLNLLDNLSLLVGVRAVKLEQDGFSYGAPQTVSDRENVPYYGITYEILNGTMLYASYSEVFKQQTFVDTNLNPLGPVKGESYEVGVKQEVFSGNAVLTFALFNSEQENFGDWITRDTDTGLNIYRGIEFKSDGYEIELTGEVYSGLNLSAGFTQIDVVDQNGIDTRRFIPTEQFKLAAGYQLSRLPALRVGTGINWQNEIYYGDIEVQSGYALVDFFARYNVNSNVTFAVNIHNVTDEKYRLSPQWGQANFGAPRNIWVSVAWQF